MGVKPLVLHTMWSMSSATVLLVSLGFLLLYLLAAEHRRRQAINKIPGPRAPSWVFGNLLQTLLPKRYGEHETSWQQTYGGVYRFKGGFGRDRLMVSDVAALQHIFNSNDFISSPAHLALVHWLFSPRGVLGVYGKEHRQIRATLNVGFTSAAVRSYLPIFERVAQKTSERLDFRISNSGHNSTVADLCPLFNNATVDAISEATLGCRVDDLSPDFVRTTGQVIELSASVSPAQLLVDEIINLWLFPSWLLFQAVKLPAGSIFKLLRDHVRFAEQDGRRIVQNKLKLAKSGVETAADVSDVYGQVVHAKILGNNITGGMEMQDLIAQTSILIIAGQDTSANVLSWTFVELSRNEAVQESLREEIVDLTAKGVPYEQFPLLNAVIKEVLRLYPAVPVTPRIATRDTVLPLSQSITTTDGHIIDRIPIRKGQLLSVSIFSYQRMKSLWGEDADVFDPSRWIEGRVPQGSALGPYANLLAFSSGPHHCLGWRFALLEMQVIIAELVRKFTFAVPDKEVVATGYATVLMPVDEDGNRRAAFVVKRVL
ncbi:cytochrome P450 [Mycena amicta]|nr:cytochrome P450 [Mycena amicta]